MVLKTFCQEKISVTDVIKVVKKNITNEMDNKYIANLQGMFTVSVN